MDLSLGLNNFFQNWEKIENNVRKLIDELSDDWFDFPTSDNAVPVDDVPIDRHPITDANKLEDNTSMETLKTCAQAESTISSLEYSSEITGRDVFYDALSKSVICDGNGKESFSTQAPANGFLASENCQDDMNVQLMLPCTTPNEMLVVDVPINGDHIVHTIKKSEDNLINENANCAQVELAISSLEDLSLTMSLDIARDDSSQRIVYDDDENESLANKFHRSSFLADTNEANEVLLSLDLHNDMDVELTQARCTLPDGELVVNAQIDGDRITDINESEDNFNKSTVREISTCAEVESTICSLENSRDDSGQNIAIDENRKESFATKVPGSTCDDNEKEPFAISIPANQVLTSETHQNNTTVELRLSRCSLPNESYATLEISHGSRNEEIFNSIKAIDLNAKLGDLDDVDLKDTLGDDENYELALASSMESKKKPYWVKLKASVISNLRWLKENKQLRDAYRSVYLRKQHKERSHPSSFSTLSRVHDSLESDWELL